jgi:hypothetical protein
VKDTRKGQKVKVKGRKGKAGARKGKGKASARRPAAKRKPGK